MAKRRRNPMRSVGALIVNPRRRNAKRHRKATKSRRRNPLKVRLNKGRRRGHKRSHSRARRNPLKVRLNKGRRRRNPLKVRLNRGKGRRRASKGRRKNAGRRRNLKIGKFWNKGRRRNAGKRRGGVRVAFKNRGKGHGRRRNRGGSMMGAGLLGSLRRMLGKIPFIGGAAASAIGFLPFAIGGALGVEPTLQLARFLSPYLPAIPSSLYYVGTSLVVAALVQKFLPVAPATREKIAVAIAAAGGGVAFYKMRTGQDADIGSETGMLEMAGVGSFAGALGDSLGLGDGFQTSIVPYAGYGSAIYGV